MFLQKNSHFDKTPFSNSADQFSVFLRTTYQYFCRTPLIIRTLISISTEHLSVSLWNTSKYLYRTPVSVSTEHLSVSLQNTSTYFYRTPLSISAEDVSISTSQNFCRRRLSTSANSISVFL